MQTQLLLTLLSARALLCAADWGEIFKYGNDPESSQARTGSPWTYDAAGDDWEGTDKNGAPWICLQGQQQSPINIPAAPGSATTAVAAEHRSIWQLGALQSNGSNIAVVNSGHTVEVSWNDAAFAPTVSIVLQEGRHLLSNLDLQRGNKAQTVQAEARQFHFHTSSEHLIAGSMFPLEAHLVSVIPRAVLPHCPPDGCSVVTTVLFELAPDDANNTWLQPLFNAMPDREGQVAFLPAGQQLDLQQLVPGNTSYVAYGGSFTTPPCTEGVLWLAFVTRLQISVQQWRHFMRAVGDYNCTAVNGSTLVGLGTAEQQQPSLIPAAANNTAGSPEPAEGGASTSNSSSNMTAADGGNSSKRVLLAAPAAAARAAIRDSTAAAQHGSGLHPHHMQQQQWQPPSQQQQAQRHGRQQAQQWQFQRYFHLPASTSFSDATSTGGGGSHGTRQLRAPLVTPAAGAAGEAADNAVHATVRGSEPAEPAAAAATLVGQHYVCNKLGAGQNARLPQPLHGRVLRVFRDLGSGKKSLLPEDAATAAGAGAIAGIVLGTTLGATLTGVIGFYAYKAYQRRRLKRLYHMGVSSNDMMMVQQEVESQWLREGPGSGAPGHGSSSGGAVAIGGSSSIAGRLSPRNQAAL